MAESDAKNLETALVSARNYCEHKINMCLYHISCTVHKLRKLGEMYQNANDVCGTPESIAGTLLLCSDNTTTIKKQVESWNMPCNFTRSIAINNIAEGVVILENAMAIQNSMCEICEATIRDSPFSIDYP